MLRWYSVCCTVWYCWWGWLTDQPTGLSGCDEQLSHTRQYHYQMWTCGGRYQCLLTGMWIFRLYRIPSLCKHPDLTQQHSLWLWMMVWLISAEMRANVCVIFVIVCPMQCMALDRYKINWVYVSVCLSVRKTYRPSIATAVFVLSSSNFKCGSHIWQRRVRSMASNTGSSKMFTVISTLIWTVLTGQTDWVCHIGTLTLCIDAVA